MNGKKRKKMKGEKKIKEKRMKKEKRKNQVKRDIKGFWIASYADVRKDMRAKYPRHPWPEDPTQADPTLRAKPRKY